MFIDNFDKPRIACFLIPVRLNESKDANIKSSLTNFVIKEPKFFSFSQTNSQTLTLFTNNPIDPFFLIQQQQQQPSIARNYC